MKTSNNTRRAANEITVLIGRDNFRREFDHGL